MSGSGGAVTGTPGHGGLSADPARTAPPVPPSVSFAAATRADSATHVQLESFDGPLGLLLALIEARKLDVLTVPLGALAGAYLEALATLESDRLGNISSFIAVASQLILIKSRAILPRRAPDAAPPFDEIADPEEELRRRLVLYRAYRDAGGRLAEGALAWRGLHRREPALAQAAGLAGARPGEMAPLDPASLEAALRGLIRVVPPPALLPEALPRTITIGERADVIRAALARVPRVVLQEILRGVSDRVVVAITFLAMLELMKRREIVVEQAEPWGPIVARATTAAERGSAPLPADPIDESLEDFA